MTYYIDPGTTKGCAVASFDTRRLLVGLGFWIPYGWRSWCGDHWPVTGALWEKPQHYPSAGGRKGTATANDLIELAAAGATCAAVLGWGRGGVRSVKPREWKKQIPKPIHHMRALNVLTMPELDLLAEAYGGLDLVAYVRAAAIRVAKKAPGGYSAQITDLLDAVCLGLWDVNRLRV